MPTRNQINLPPPKDWQELQRLVTDLYKKIWNNEYIQQFGSSGQAQNGVDIYGFPNSDKKVEGIQCKCVEKLRPKDIVNVLRIILEVIGRAYMVSLELLRVMHF